MIGTRNEAFVLKIFDDLSKYDTNISCVEEPLDFGLVASIEKPWLVTSIDGFVQCKINGERTWAVIEIKTVSAERTLTEDQDSRLKINFVTYCTFENR